MTRYLNHFKDGRAAVVLTEIPLLLCHPFSNHLHMIARKKKIQLGSNEVSIMVSFSPIDLKKSLKRMFFQLEQSVNRTFATTSPNSEQDLMFFFEKDMFSLFEPDTRQQLSRWAVVQSKKNGFIYEGSEPNVYFLNPELGRRAGRPAKDSPDTI